MGRFRLSSEPSVRRRSVAPDEDVACLKPAIGCGRRRAHGPIGCLIRPVGREAHGDRSPSFAARGTRMLPKQLAWWIAGPGVGLCVVAMYALANRRLGVSGGWLQLVNAAQRRPVTEGWRLFFNGGLVIGAIIAALLGAGRSAAGYGALGDACPAL